MNARNGVQSLLLLPTPRSVKFLGEHARRPSWLTEKVVRSKWEHACGGRACECDAARLFVEPPADRIYPEGYSLSIRRDGNGEATVALRAFRRGARYGLATLMQILRQCGDEIPCIDIEDAPGFDTRGVMLDVSRDRVPTMPELKRAIDLLAELKFNHLQLYTEHTFAYAGHEEVWEGWSPITPAEARELDAYAAAKGIELAPNQNCFGHLSHWLKRPRYQHLAEIEGDAPWKFMHFERRGPFSLCPVEPRAEEFMRGLLGQLLPCFSSARVNIGCDETFDVGWGRSRSEVERRAGGNAEARERARVELYFDFVAKIARACAEHGKRPMMWADIALSHPEMLQIMPAGMIGLAWCYEPTDKFDRWVGLLREHGHEAWVCPGTSSWRSFTGRTTERRANIADAAEQGARAGARGFLVCDWGDLGHRQQWPIALAGIAQAAEAAWNPAKAREFDARAASLHVFDDPAGRVGPWLDELGDSDLRLRQSKGVRNATALFNDLHPPVPEALALGGRAVKATVLEWAKGCHVRSSTEWPPFVPSELLAREIEHIIDVARFADSHGTFVREPDAPRHWKRAMADWMKRIIAEHRALWLERSRPGGLDHSCSYYQGIIDTLETGPGAA